MSEVDDDTISQLLQSLRLAQIALDEGFKVIVERCTPLRDPVAQEFFQILCNFKDSQEEFHRIIGRDAKKGNLQ